MNIKENVLQTIREKHITPLSRWKFTVRNGLMWVLIYTCAVLVIILISISMFHLGNGNNAIFDDLETPMTDQIITIIPLFWIGTTFILALIAFLIFKKTVGYRRATMHFASLFLLVATICGAIIYITHGAEYLERAVGSIPYYDNLIPTKRILWSHEEKGMLGGTVVTDSTTTPFSMRDFDGDIWLITGPVYEAEDDVVIGKGVKLGIIGRVVQPRVFEAIEIRTW